MIEKNWNKYQNKTLDNKVENLLLEFLSKYNDIETFIDLGCGAGNESVYLLHKGYKVTAIDKQLNKSFILDRLNNNEKKNVTFIENDFKDLTIPKVDCIIAMFSIPFCNPKYFNDFWNKIFDSIKTNGYFVGQLFGNRDSWTDKKTVNTFTKEKILEMLSKYEILLFDEIEYTKKPNNKNWHYFNIIAKKSIDS